MHTASIVSTQFYKNEACRGGAVFSDSMFKNASVAIKNSTFKGNYGGDLGGAIYVSYVDMTRVTQSSFIKNGAATAGGGIFVPSQCSSVFIEANRFEKNKAYGEGGGYEVLEER